MLAPLIIELHTLSCRAETYDSTLVQRQLLILALPSSEVIVG
jgi:hypothetical protein